MPRIRTAADIFGTRTSAEHHAWLLSQPSVRDRMAALDLRDEQIGKPDKVDGRHKPAEAFVDQGRWVADCPKPRCGGAVLLQPGVPFLCGYCLNIDIGYEYRPVKWPDEQAEIERALLPRSLPEEAHWKLGESVEALLAENVAAGLEAVL